ncbi:hypothetical protein HNR60_002873 [Rhodopseudomonas rhenobacensis]|uniref:High potential iron-sulfur proteins family profile domain-containing protein n=1 Tax=Rhodopseudomonas rhenobacensis TaxID=87461 RepID=A0A7W7Z4Z4_9BRAD|nr:high potential iron sulfur protein [Rhodopseudomonas rhenobacensis]MBB5048112.1 hypothetical protein [Rhodopseudomonas rhenobacensis]
MNDKTKNSDALSRRRLLRTGAYAVGAAAMIGVAATAADAQVAKKASHASAGYQETPNAGKSCGSCRQFQPPSSCLTVESPISGNGWCRLYAKKA